jgi:tRNA nucleotidyltransferase (CCA-adding enzyme)
MSDMNIQEVAIRIKQAGGRLFYVGGGVRDELMGLSVKDKDYCVTGLTQDGFLELFPNAFLAGQQFPVFRLSVDGRTTEFALARVERKIAEGHTGFHVESSPEVTIEQDLFRRDLTINAIARDVLTGELVDPFGGQADIQSRVIRAVSDAFSEDPLRVYRAARFHAQFEFDIDDHTLGMMRDLRHELDSLSVERVFAELRKALTVKRPSLFFRALESAGVLDVHFPEIHALIGVPQPVKWHPEGDAFEHSMQVLDAAARHTDRVEVRFAALVHDVGKARTPRDKWPSHHGHEAAGVPVVKGMCKRLKLPVEWCKAASFATEHHMKVHHLNQMKPIKVVDLLTSAHKNPLGVNGFAVVGLADVQGRGNPQVRDENAERMEDMWAYVQQVNGHTLQNEQRIEVRGKGFGDLLRRERARKVEEWRRMRDAQRQSTR